MLFITSPVFGPDFIVRSCKFFSSVEDFWFCRGGPRFPAGLWISGSLPTSVIDLLSGHMPGAEPRLLSGLLISALCTRSRKKLGSRVGAAALPGRAGEQQ